MKVAFLDRDGVINKEVDYLHRIEDFEYTYRCTEGLQNLIRLGFGIAIISNQSGIARGYYTEQDYHQLTHWIKNNLRSKGIELLDIIHCPHHPTGSVKSFTKVCTCRKPKPGMIHQVAEQHSVNLKESILVGDRISDIDAAKRAGVGRSVLVESGHPFDSSSTGDVSIFPNLYKFTLSLCP